MPQYTNGVKFHDFDNLAYTSPSEEVKVERSADDTLDPPAYFIDPDNTLLNERPTVNLGRIASLNYCTRV